MSDDLAVLRNRVPEYRGYDREGDRHDTDIRIRALLGGALTRARARAGDGEVRGPLLDRFERVLMRCMFGDQRFVKRFEHVDLDDAVVGRLVASDRHFVDLADRADRLAAPDELGPILEDVDAAFADRDGLIAR